MKEAMIELFRQYQEIAFLLSIFINIVISILAVVPSAFLTAANVYVFGFQGGLIVSIIGEALGALCSFWIYRKGFLFWFNKKDKPPKFVKKLQGVEGFEAFKLIFFLRLLPFVPSGAVTAMAAVSSVSLLAFFTASTLGKIPAVFLEVYAVNEVMNKTALGKGILTVMGLLFAAHYIYKKRRSSV